MYAWLQQARDTVPWRPADVQDTVAAIARDAAYRRSLTSSLIGRLFRFLGEVWRRVIHPFRESADLRRVVIVLVVLLIVVVVVRTAIAARAVSDASGAPHARGPGQQSDDAWGDAQRLASAARFTEAAHALYAALLAQFAGRGEVKLHPSKTAGDYARELRRRGSPDQGGFRAFRARYDRVIYGSGICTSDDYSALLRDALPLLERAA